MKLKSIYILTLAAALSVSCKPDVNKDLEWPEWASRPIITDASLTSKDGRRTLEAGEKAVYVAHLSDEYNELSSYTLTIRYGGKSVYEVTRLISGNEYAVNEEFVMPFAPYLEGGGYIPEVIMTAFNEKNGTFSQRLSMDSNVSVTRPQLPSSLYIVDDIGNIYTLNSVAGTDVYSPEKGSDFSSLGSSFHIAAKVNGSEPDFSDLVWGDVDGELAIVDSQSPYAAPSTGGYGFKKLDFNVFSFSLDKLVDYTVTLNKDDMLVEDHGGVTYYCMKDVSLVQDCEFVFEGFGALASFLQPDRFEVIDEKTAKFTGHSALWSVYYDADDNWLIVNYAVNNTSDQIWVTGIKACFPLGNDSTEHEFGYLEGDGKVRYATLSAIKDNATDYHCLLYLKEGFHLQLYRYIKWSTVVSMTSVSPETALITDDGQYITAGADFVPGLYMLDIRVTQEINNVGDGCEAEVSLTPFVL